MNSATHPRRQSGIGGGVWTNPRTYRPRHYPWDEIREGEVHPRIFPLSQLVNARQSLRNFNASNRTPLTIREERNGTPEHPEPHFRVGWDPSHTFAPGGVIRTSPEPQRRRKPKQAKEENSETESGQKE